MSLFDSRTPALLHPRRAALRAALVIWAFAILTADAGAMWVGRADIWISVPVSVPIFLSGVALTLGLTRLWLLMQDWPSALSWPAIALAIVAVSAAQTAIDLAYYRWIATELLQEWQAWALAVSEQRIVTAFILYLWLFGLGFTLLWALGVYDTARLNAIRASASEAVALRLQLNPHFMVNTLNVIASLIAVDRKTEAEDMTCKLAEFLRASLSADPAAIVPLEDELATAEAYLDIEQVRCGDRMDVLIDVPETLGQAAVPNFILQPLVENAVKYGVAPTRAPVRIAISAARDGASLLLSVTNRAIGEEGVIAQENAPPRHSGHVGLANIRQRLFLAYGEDAMLETAVLDSGYQARITLPYSETDAPAALA